MESDQHRPATPPALASLVMQLLEKRAADRPQRAESVRGTLDGVMTASESMAPFPPAVKKRRPPAWTIATVVAVAMSFVIIATRSGAGSSGMGAMVGMTPNGDIVPYSVAVLPFANVGKDSGGTRRRRSRRRTACSSTRRSADCT